MHKNYKHGIISGNTIRFAGYNQKTSKKIKMNNLNTLEKKTSKQYKIDYMID